MSARSTLRLFGGRLLMATFGLALPFTGSFAQAPDDDDVIEEIIESLDGLEPVI